MSNEVKMPVWKQRLDAYRAGDTVFEVVNFRCFSDAERDRFCYEEAEHIYDVIKFWNANMRVPMNEKLMSSLLFAFNSCIRILRHGLDKPIARNAYTENKDEASSCLVKLMIAIESIGCLGASAADSRSKFRRIVVCPLGELLSAIGAFYKAA